MAESRTLPLMTIYTTVTTTFPFGPGKGVEYQYLGLSGKHPKYLVLSLGFKRIFIRWATDLDPASLRCHLMGSVSNRSPDTLAKGLDAAWS